MDHDGPVVNAQELLGQFPAVHSGADAAGKDKTDVHR
jgi:hypothetical protein